jgi:thiamine biosynthesis protein ThiS
MELKINNQTKQFRPDSLTVQALLGNSLKQNGIAIAINNTIIPKLAFTLPQQTDDILIISATQGLSGCSGGLFVTSPQVKLKT